MAADLKSHHVQFVSSAPNVKEFEVSSFQGEEEISRPYRFEIELLSRQNNVKLEDMVRNTAYLALRQPIPGGEKARVRTYKIHGVLASFEQLDMLHDWVRYRAVLVPRLWKLSLSVRSRVFVNKSVKEVVKEVLESPVAGQSLFTSSDYDYKAKGGARKREFIVQYQESDLNFLSRWLEHEGIYWFVEQTEDGDKIVFADSSSAYAVIPGNPKIPYRSNSPGAGGAAGVEDADTAAEEAVQSFVARQHEIPSKVVLNDYQYGAPSAPMRAEETVDAKDDGEVYLYGLDYADQTEGKSLAKICAEELRCRQRVFAGRSDCRSLRAGLKFSLDRHYRADFNGGDGYLITRIQHKGSQSLNASGGGTGTLAYTNEFSAIPAGLTFRPERRTPRPHVAGLIPAKVDASGDGKYAEIDDQGRYKVKLQMDLSPAKDGKASHFLRMAQPYAGGSMGMHFPLHKGAEVLLSCENGDPDRPLIASSIPNPETAGPVCGPNQTQSVILSGGGNKIVLEDKDGEQQILIHSPVKGTSLTLGHDPEKPGTNLGTEGFRKCVIGADDLLEVAGNQESTIQGNRTDTVNGNEDRTIGGDASLTIGGKRTTSISSTDELTVGSDRTESVGGKSQTTVGSKTQFTTGSDFKVTAGAKIALTAGAKVAVVSPAMGITAGSKIAAKSGGPVEIKAGGAIKAQSGGPTQVKAGGPCKIEAAKIQVKGPTDIKGDVKIKGATQIKGDTKITGATQIKGATKIKGATDVTGAFKVKGTTFSVS